jgi:uncharacterized membrane protein
MIGLSLLFFLLIITECFGDWCFHYTIHNKHSKGVAYFAGLIMYLLMGVIYFRILEKYDNLAVPNAMYQCFSVIAVTLLSYVVLKEEISNQKLIGIAVIIFGLGLIQTG